jgi:tetratricopeptide (TPR) repeat protein
MKKVMENDASRMQKKTFVLDAQGTKYAAYYYVAALNTMGSIYIQDGRLEDAEALYSELFKVDPDFPLAKNNYAYLQELKADK